MLRSILAILIMWNGIFFIPGPSLQTEKQTIQHVIKQKENAVNHHNRKLFLSLLHPQNKMYVQEQKHWFEDAVHYMDEGSFHLNLLKVQLISKSGMKGWISQEYTHKSRKWAVEYPLLFRKTKEGWKDADISFQQNAKGPFTVYYTDEKVQDQAQIALTTLQKASMEFKKRFSWIPEHVEVKLYHQPEVFRQSVKPSLPLWAGGWHESKQAIKFIGGAIDDVSFSQGIVHELTHQMVSELTNDNAAYWLQEGAAMYYERHLMGDQNKKPFYEGSLLSLSQLEKINLESLPDKEAGRYYVSCYDVFHSLLQKYGEKKLGKMLNSLRAYPEIDLESVQKMKIVNQRTRKAIQECLH